MEMHQASSVNLDQLFLALAKAQGEMRAPIKDKTAKVRMKAGGEYSYSYADLATVIDTVRPVLAKYELSIVQITTQVDGRLMLVTSLGHSSGQWISSSHPLQGNPDPRVAGSEWTYYRRYSLCSILGIATEDDDDAERVVPTPPTPMKATQTQPRASGTPIKAIPAKSNVSPISPKSAEPLPPSDSDPISRDQQVKIFAMLKDAGWEEADLRSYLKTVFGSDKTSALTRGQANEVINNLNAEVLTKNAEQDFFDGAPG